MKEATRLPISLQNTERTPHHCVWEITNACNLQCVHCESSSGCQRKNELSTSEALDLCDSLKAIGCHTINISGGEPFLRPDLFKICDKINSLAMEPIIVSNFTTLTEDLIQKLKIHHIKSLATSIDGPQAIHDRIRLTFDKKLSPFEKTLETIKTLKKEGFFVAVVTHINRWNLPFFDETVDILENLKIDLWQVQIGFPAGRLIEIAEDYLITPGEMADLSEKLAKTRKISPLRIDVADNIGFYGPNELTLRSSKCSRFWGGCFAGYRSIYISADGNVQGCPSLEISAGNIREESLVEIWNDESRFWYNSQWGESKLEGKCKACSYKRLCRGGCKSMALSTTGTIYRNIYCENQLINLNGDPQRREVNGKLLKNSK